MSIAYGPKKILNLATAGADHVSAAIDLSLYVSCSIQLVWAGLTGTIDGTLTVEVSDDGVAWDTKKLTGGSNGVITVAGAAANDTLSFDQNLNERYLRANWAKNGVTGGTVTCLATAKG